MSGSKWSTTRLEAQARALGTKSANAKLRAEFRLPAVLYGPSIKENINLSVDYVAFEKLFAVNERHRLFALALDGKEYHVIVKDYKIDPISRRFMHVDFYAVEKGKKYQTLIPIEYVGIPIGVREGGNLLTYKRKVSVQAVPEKMPEKITVDISKLQKKQYVIVRDLGVADGIAVRTNKGTVLAEVK